MSVTRDDQLLRRFFSSVFSEEADVTYDDRDDAERIRQWTREEGDGGSLPVVRALHLLAEETCSDLDLAWALRRDWAVGRSQDPLTAGSARSWLLWCADAIDAELASGEA